MYLLLSEKILWCFDNSNSRIKSDLMAFSTILNNINGSKPWVNFVC